MQQDLTEEIQECRQHAEWARRKAAETREPVLKGEFLDLERHWLFLARCYEYSERLSRITAEADRPRIGSAAGQ
jgi:hypothetical protein